MSVQAAPVRLSMLGPSDLLVTSLVAGLRARGVEAERIPLHDVPSGARVESRRRPSVLVVDVDAQNWTKFLNCAVQAGATVLVIGSESLRERAAAAIAAGAVGWVSKTSSLDVFTETVHAAAEGRMCERTRAAWLAEHRVASESVRSELGRLEQLSPREREVLRHLADGLRAADISELLFLSMATVRSHIRSIMVKLDVHSQHDAADTYRQMSWRLTRMFGTEQAS